MKEITINIDECLEWRAACVANKLNTTIDEFISQATEAWPNGLEEMLIERAESESMLFAHAVLKTMEETWEGFCDEA